MDSIKTLCAIKKSVLVLFIFNFSSLLIRAQDVTVAGKVTVRPAANNKKFWNATILIKQDTLFVAHTAVDTNLLYRLTVTEKKQHGPVANAEVFIAGRGLDTQYVKTIVLIKNSYITCNMDFPRRYEKNVLGQVICPECQHPEAVIELGDGGLPRTSAAESATADNAFVPHYYCRHCMIKF